MKKHVRSGVVMLLGLAACAADPALDDGDLKRSDDDAAQSISEQESTHGRELAALRIGDSNLHFIEAVGGGVSIGEDRPEGSDSLLSDFDPESEGAAEFFERLTGRDAPQALRDAQTRAEFLETAELFGSAPHEDDVGAEDAETRQKAVISPSEFSSRYCEEWGGICWLGKSGYIKVTKRSSWIRVYVQPRTQAVRLTMRSYKVIRGWSEELNQVLVPGRVHGWTGPYYSVNRDVKVEIYDAENRLYDFNMSW